MKITRRIFCWVAISFAITSVSFAQGGEELFFSSESYNYFTDMRPCDSMIISSYEHGELVSQQLVVYDSLGRKVITKFKSPTGSSRRIHQMEYVRDAQHNGWVKRIQFIDEKEHPYLKEGYLHFFDSAGQYVRMVHLCHPKSKLAEYTLGFRMTEPLHCDYATIKNYTYNADGGLLTEEEYFDPRFFITMNFKNLRRKMGRGMQEKFLRDKIIHHYDELGRKCYKTRPNTYYETTDTLDVFLYNSDTVVHLSRYETGYPDTIYAITDSAGNLVQRFMPQHFHQTFSTDEHGRLMRYEYTSQERTHVYVYDYLAATNLLEHVSVMDENGNVYREERYEYFNLRMYE